MIHLDFSLLAYKEIGLKEALLSYMAQVAESYQLDDLKEEAVSLRFIELIEDLSQKNKIVIRVGEYDKPIIEYLEDIPQAEASREILRHLFSVIKELDRYLF